jgi:hypothetical protein
MAAAVAWPHPLKLDLRRLPVLHRAGAAAAETEMGPSTKLTLAVVALLTSSCAGDAPSARAQTSPSQSWPEVKCSRYRKAWSEALQRRGTQGLGREFLERHEAFLASGCTTRADVCPRSAAELDLANMMVVAAMNAGTASTFPPFSCR